MKKTLIMILTVVMLLGVSASALAVDATSGNTVKTSIVRIESKANGFKVIYKKKSKIKGYQIQYSTSSKFKNSSTKTKAITSNKTTSVTIGKLKGCNIKYYVRVRTYRISNRKKVYSSWSKTKAVTTLNHNFSKATCLKPKTCSICKKTSGKSLGHSYNKGICKRCKKTRYANIKKDIAGYYWYLDGYKYTYLHPTVIPWYDHELLQWESKNIQIYKNKLTAYENYTYEKYREIDLQASVNTHNTLLVNPVEFGDDLVREYKMRVDGNKLYMIVGGKEYSFTRYKSPKKVNISLELGFEQAVAKVGEHIFLPIKISPFWEYHQIEVVEDASNNYSVAYHDRWYSSDIYPFGSGGDSNDGETTMIFYAQSVGSRTLNIRVNGTQKTYQFNITVLPEKATGVTLNKLEIILNKGDIDTLVATVMPENASEKAVTWASSDDSVVTVSANGEITAKKYGTATITATTKDGGFTASCNVTVRQDPLKADASIGISVRSIAGSIKSGIIVTANATGGTENYIAYSIKLYRDDTYIGEVFEKEMFVTPLMNGTYTAEVYVKDSNGNEVTTIQTTTISF